MSDFTALVVLSAQRVYLSVYQFLRTDNMFVRICFCILCLFGFVPNLTCNFKFLGRTGLTRFLLQFPDCAFFVLLSKFWYSSRRSAASFKSLSETILYRSKTDRVLCPVTFIATVSGTLALTRLREAVRLKSCTMRFTPAFS